MGEFDDESGNESGRSLRDRLEAVLQQNKELAGKLKTFEVSKLIAEKGYTYVKPEDLADVDLAELSKKAEGLEKAGAERRESVLREVLSEQGLEGDALDQALQTFLAPKEESTHEISSRIADLGRIKGKAVDLKDEGKTGQDLIYAALS